MAYLSAGSKIIFIICYSFINDCYAPDDLPCPDSSSDDELIAQAVTYAYEVISRAFTWDVKDRDEPCYSVINTFNFQSDYESLKAIIERNNHEIISPFSDENGITSILRIIYSSNKNAFYIFCSSFSGYLSFKNGEEFTIHKHEYTNADH